MSCPTYTNTTFETTYAQNQDKVVAYQMHDKTSAFCLTAKKALRAVHKLRMHYATMGREVQNVHMYMFCQGKSEKNAWYLKSVFKS